jgi:hypothetical protein
VRSVLCDGSGRTVASVETAGGGGAGSRRTITAIETFGGGGWGADNGIQLATKTVIITRAAVAEAAVILMVRWQDAATGGAVDVLGLL